MATIVALAASIACSSEEPRSEGAPMAGVSENLDAPVTPHEPAEFGADTTMRAYDRFRHRCAGCHPAPSPAMHDAAGWGAVFARMEGHVEEAGLIRLQGSEGEAILELLRDHAAESRRDRSR